MKISNDDYSIKPLIKEHGKLLKNWGRFDDPLYYGYEYSELSEKELELWYLMKRRINRAEYYSVFSKDNHLIGYVGIKEINPMLRSSMLGIVIDPNYTSKGFGTRIMNDFLEYYFLEKKFRRLNLEVNSWNERAIRLYEKLGFKHIDFKYISFENQDINLEDEEFENYRDDFKIENGVLFSKIFKMSLERQEYLNEIRNRE